SCKPARAKRQPQVHTYYGQECTIRITANPATSSAVSDTDMENNDTEPCAIGTLYRARIASDSSSNAVNSIGTNLNTDSMNKLLNQTNLSSTNQPTTTEQPAVVGRVASRSNLLSGFVIDPNLYYIPEAANDTLNQQNRMNPSNASINNYYQQKPQKTLNSQ